MTTTETPTDINRASSVEELLEEMRKIEEAKNNRPYGNYGGHYRNYGAWDLD